MIGLTRYAEANAIARALLPRLLSTQDYAALAHTTSVQEAWNVLRRTAYGEWLTEEMAPDSLTIERRFREVTAAWFQKPVQRLGGRAAPVGQLLLARWELDHLEFSLRIWHGRNAGFEALLAFLLFLHNVAAVQLLNAETLDEIAALLRNTPYAAPLHASAPEYQKSGSILCAEIALERDYYLRLLAAVRALGTADARIGERLVSDEIDEINLSWIARLHEYPDLSVERISGMLIPGPSPLSQQLTKPGPTYQTVVQPVIARLARRWEGEARSGPPVERALQLERVVAEMAIARARTALGSYPFTIAGIFAFHGLLRAELRNLCCVFAGKQFGTGVEDLMSRIRGVV